MSVFIPEEWLTSAFDAIQDYISSKVDAFVLDPGNNPVGLQAYSVVMDYPTPETLPIAPEFQKTIIHLAIDDIDNRRLGFGDGQADAVITDPTVDDPGTVAGAEGQSHVINFDVGIWASDKSGGSTSRLRAYQMLHSLFGTEIARKACQEETEGVEIIRFTNGRFIIETVNDIRTYRMVGAELVVRVFSRTLATPDVFADGDPVVDPDIEIGDETIVDS